MNNHASLTKVYEINEEAELTVKDPIRKQFAQISRESAYLAGERNL